MEFANLNEGRYETISYLSTATQASPLSARVLGVQRQGLQHEECWNVESTLAKSVLADMKRAPLAIPWMK